MNRERNREQGREGRKEKDRGTEEGRKGRARRGRQREMHITKYIQ